MLTDEGDLVVDPFAGSNVTGEVCERLNRAWIATEIVEDYLKASTFRFVDQIEVPAQKKKTG
jgi:site-specific DNA-methyltransferase (cytosine-N4-specific)